MLQEPTPESTSLIELNCNMITSKSLKFLREIYSKLYLKYIGTKKIFL
ncbi:hypothetical protein H359_0677 [Chlamydia ibidis 10-1398/6]|uniref:Nef attachable domain protein n=1 Tax=Chlamydia ibidis 10-1398/6 TaxID=1046581 RepID=A0ABP2XEA4_9CHLA|nr:hypothetical protein H359_0677 [Chlamydia ibidis 10-1398/6]